MKKLALILALLVIPCAAFGLEMLNDNAMDQVTGQAGVSIAVDDVQLFINIEKLAYIDCDGFDTFDHNYGTCTGSPGAVALNNFQIDVLNINGIVDGTYNGAAANDWSLQSTACGVIPLFYDYATNAVTSCYLGSNETLGLNNYINPNTGLTGADGADFVARALTIDVTDDLPTLTEGSQANGDAGTIGGVLIGIPTLEIYINSMSLTPVYDGDVGTQNSTARNDDDAQTGALAQYNATYGTIEMTGITFTTLSGWIEIAPH